MKKLYTLCLLHTFMPLISMEISIEPYNKMRDLSAIETILDTYPDWLRYENQGHPEGTTEKYIESDKFITEVARINDQTVGFINYTAFDINVCTFHFSRRGMINLIGVHQEHQKKGYGKQLLTHAIEELKNEKVSSITLMVKSNNISAQKLYKTVGFTCAYDGTAIQPDTLPFAYNTNIPTDYSRGNCIQKNPKLAAALLVGGTTALLAYRQASAL